MEIIMIINKNTHQEVCPQYLHQELNMDKTKIEVGKPLIIVYKDNSFFTHEKVINVEYPDEATIKVETSKKIWMIQE